MTNWTVITIVFVLCTNISFHTNAYDTNRENVDVLNLPFLALVKIPKKLHLISDQFILTQSINVKPLIEHLKELENGLTKVKNKYFNSNVTLSNSSNREEEKLVLILEQAAQTISSGIQLLPKKDSCDVRSKRSLKKNVNKRYVDLDSETDAVDTKSLFPALGNMFSWITGTLSSQAGEVINANYKNVKKLTKMSLKFADMINATLSIERKHKKQIERLNTEVMNLEFKLDESLGRIERNLAYSNFLQNMVVVALDLQRTIDNIFDLTDKAEYNRMGSFARDPVFLQTIWNMMDYKSRNKRDSLYLMKISSKIQVHACQWVILVSYKFPVLESIDLIPRRVLSIPKDIKGKFFELQHIPHVVSWGEKVYSFTETEFKECDHHNSHIMCRAPTHMKNLLDSCLYGIVHSTPWPRLANKCSLVYTKTPEEFVEFTESHMVFFFRTPRYATIICEGYSKPLTLEGSGVIELPTGCRVKYGDQETFSLGHIARTKNIALSLDDRIYHANFSGIIPMMTVSNVKNVTALLLDTSKEEKIIEEGLTEVNQIFSVMKFSPTATTITLWSLIIYTGFATVIFMIIIYCICAPGVVIKCKRCCGCKAKPKTVYVKDV